MEHIVADEALLSRFHGFMEPVEIRDPEGNLIGVYTPNVTPEMKAMYERAVELFDWEEIDRRRKNPGKMYTYEEVMARLRSLEQGQ
jgi:hypothetical protein